MSTHPLYTSKADELFVNKTVDQYLNFGIPYEKMAMGLRLMAEGGKIFLEFMVW